MWLFSVSHQKWTFHLTVKMLASISTTYAGVTGSLPTCRSYLQLPNKIDRGSGGKEEWWWPEHLGYCSPHRRVGLNFKLPVWAWSNPSYWRHLGNEPAVWNVLSLSQINKRKINNSLKRTYNSMSLLMLVCSVCNVFLSLLHWVHPHLLLRVSSEMTDSP